MIDNLRGFKTPGMACFPGGTIVLKPLRVIRELGVECVVLIVIGSSLMKPQIIASSIRRRRADPNAAPAARQRVGSCIDAFGGGGRLARRSSSGERPRTEFSAPTGM